jgi:hypothetical protein
VGFIAAVTGELSMTSGLRQPDGVELWIDGTASLFSRSVAVPPDSAGTVQLQPTPSDDLGVTLYKA